MDDFEIILFYITFMIIFNVIVLGFSGSIVNSADYLNKQTKMDYNSICAVDFIACAIDSVGFVLNLSIPITSNIFLVTIIFKIVYVMIVIPYSILIGYIILKFIRGI